MFLFIFKAMIGCWKKLPYLFSIDGKKWQGKGYRNINWPELYNDGQNDRD